VGEWFFILKKQNYIHLFKLIEYIDYHCQKLKNEFANKLTSLKLIAYNDKIFTNNIIKLKSPEYHVSRSATLTSKSLTEYVID